MAEVKLNASPQIESIHCAGDWAKLQRRVREDLAVGLIYSTYVHNCAFSGFQATPRGYGRDALIASWLGELNGFSEQTLNDIASFGASLGGQDTPLTFAMSRGEVSATNSAETVFGSGTGRKVAYRSQSACVIAGGRVQHEWLFTDNLHIALQLGVPPLAVAQRLAKLKARTNLPHWDFGERASAEGQTGPLPCELDIVLLKNWVDALNTRRLDHLAKLYTSDAQCLAPGGRRFSGAAEISRFWLSLFAAIPDGQINAQLTVNDAKQHELGMNWQLRGHHTGPGFLAQPNGARVTLQGNLQLKVTDTLIKEEWLMFDELDLLTQLVGPQGVSNSLF